MLTTTEWPDVVAAYAPVVQTVGGAIVGAAATYFGSRSLWARERQERERQAVREREEREASELARREDQRTQRLLGAFDEMRVAVLAAAAKGAIAAHYGPTSPATMEWTHARAAANDKGLALYFISRSEGVRTAVDQTLVQLETARPMEDARLDLEFVGQRVQEELLGVRPSVTPPSGSPPSRQGPRLT